MSIANGGERLVIPDCEYGEHALTVEYKAPNVLEFITTNAHGGEEIMLDRAGVELLCRELLTWLHTYPTT